MLSFLWRLVHNLHMKMLQRNSQTEPKVKFIIFNGAQPNPTGDKTKPFTIMIYMSGSKKKFQTL